MPNDKFIAQAGLISGCIVVSATLLAASAAVAGIESADVNLDYVSQKALERARQPFHSPRADLPDFLRADQLDYDHYREIEFRADHALWASEKLPFEIEFFHPGYLYEEPIHANEFVPGHVQDIRFVSDFFNYRGLHFKKQIPANTGYAGFKVLCALNAPDRMDELGAFLGASYYRLLGKGQHYGQSARGLAVDCGENGRPEEFPIFTDWWLGKPQPKDDQLHLFAILDSVSCAGAYEFRIRPGQSTVSEIEAVVYLRERDKVTALDSNRPPISTIGLAPLTSMFWFGPASEARFDDYRAEVHDSDGLLMRFNNGETVWRPLDNPARLTHQRFAATNIGGFGLLQRTRDPASYQDLFNSYQAVPSVWIQPRGNWGEGQIHLVELNTHYEGLDNIVAFWSPAHLPAPLQPLRFSYTQSWTLENDMNLATNKVSATRIGIDSRDSNRRQVAIDFSGEELFKIAETNPPVAIASCSDNGAIVENQVFKVPYNGAWRAILKFEPKPNNKDPIDLRCTLQHDGKKISETWTYYWNPP